MEKTSLVFVGRTDVEDWEHDEETGGLCHMLREDDDVHAGLWKPGQMAGKPIELVLEAHESVVVLAGSGRVEVDGQSVELEPGVMFSLPKGAHTRWVVDEEFTEFWVYG